MKLGHAANTDPKLRLIRKAMRGATNSYGIGGMLKRPENRRKAVTLAKVKSLAPASTGCE